MKALLEPKVGEPHDHNNKNNNNVAHMQQQQKTLPIASSDFFGLAMEFQPYTDPPSQSISVFRSPAL